MKVASDVLGDLKTAYVDKTVVKKLDEHKPLEDLDALNLIGSVFIKPEKAKDIPATQDKSNHKVIEDWRKVIEGIKQ